MFVHVEGKQGNITLKAMENPRHDSFEKERLDYITKEAIYQKCFTECFPILKLIELTHFNKEYPENQNIRYDNKKKLIKIKRNNNWATIDINNLIHNLFQQIFNSFIRI